MSIIDALGNTGKKVQILSKPGGEVFLEFDASLNEKHSREATASNFEVENGTSVSDNVALKPLTLELTGLITDTPLSTLRTLVNTGISAGVKSLLPDAGALGTLGTGAAGFLLAGAIPKASASVAAYGTLLDLQAKKVPLCVLTSLMQYENMWLTSVSVPRDPGGGKFLNFSVKFTQLLLVSPQSVDISKFRVPTAAEMKNMGKQEGVDPRAEQTLAGLKAGVRMTGASESIIK